MFFSKIPPKFLLENEYVLGHDLVNAIQASKRKRTIESFAMLSFVGDVFGNFCLDMMMLFP